MSEMILLAPWNGFAGTPVSHITGIAVTAIQPDLIKPGDYAGAIDAEGNCYGMIVWNGKNTVLVAFGDEHTTSVKNLIFDRMFPIRIKKKR